MEDRNRWIMHIKALRERHGVSIIEAESLALADPSWRRWVERQINSDTLLVNVEAPSVAGIGFHEQPNVMLL